MPNMMSNMMSVRTEDETLGPGDSSQVQSLGSVQVVTK